MNIESSISKILNPVEKHAGLIGAAGSLLTPSAIPNIMDSISIIVNGGLHAPEWQNIFNNVLQNTTPALAAAAIGYFIKDATNNSTLSKVGSILQNAGLGFTLAFAIGSTLFFSTHSPGRGNDQGQAPAIVGYSVSQGSTLGSGTGGQKLAPYMSVYHTNPTAGSMYTTTSGGRLIGN